MNYHVAILPNGLRVKCAFTQPLVQFGDDPPIRLSEPVLYPQPGQGGREEIAGIFDDYACLLSRTGRLSLYGVTHGPNSVFVDADGVLSWVFPGGRYTDATGITVNYATGSVVVYSDTRTPTPARDTTHPLSRDANGRETWGGVVVVPLGMSGSWALGEDAIAPDGRTRLVARSEWGELFIAYDGYTPVPAHIQAFGEACVVAISLPKDEQTFFVESKDFRPYVPEPLTVPDFPPCPHVMALSFSDDPEASDWSVFCTINRDDWQAAKDEALARKVPIVGYIDSHDFDFDLFESFRMFCLGIRVIPQAMCYPKPGESVTAFTSRVRPIVRALHERYPENAGVYGAAYRQWNGTSYPLDLPQVIDCARALYWLCLEYRIRVLTWFAWRRPWQADQPVVDGVLRFPELQEMARKLKAAVPSRNQFPTQHAAQPPTKPPVTPPVTPPTTTPPITFQEYLMLGSSLGLTLVASKLKAKSGPFADRLRYQTDAGEFLSVDGDGNVTLSKGDGANEAWLWKKGSGIARVWPSGPKEVLYTALVDETL